jgi:hypothetical protein
MKLLKNGDEFMAEMERTFGPPQNFSPTATYIPEGDCVEFFARPGSFYAQRIDDVVTVYLSQKDDEIVGSLIKGIKAFCERIMKNFPGFKIEIDDGKVRLEHIFLAHLWSSEPLQDKIKVLRYRRLIEVAEETNAQAELCIA